MVKIRQKGVRGAFLEEQVNYPGQRLHKKGKLGCEELSQEGGEPEGRERIGMGL